MSLIYKHPWLLFGGLLLVITFAYHVAASSPTLDSEFDLHKYQVTGKAPSLSATAFGVYDLESGEMLVSHNADVSLPIASVTKLVTAAVLFSKYDLTGTTSITTADLLAEGRAGNLQVGEEYTYRDLIFPLLLESSNDAAEFFTRVIGGSLVFEMNQLANKLELTRTNFADTSGLSDDNTSSVTDLKNLLRHIYQETPIVLDISRLRNYVGPHKGWTNNSPIWQEAYRGGKHGYTVAANRTALAIFEEKFVARDRQLIYVILGSENLAADTDKLRGFVAESVTYQ